mmetsp:Transcript_28562/g.50856  ORF Transcript_28562/g.50856 Transcript_28562/m.50856 type:complete len:621 (-) Transcript_28562:46-1908(-)
MEEPELPDWAVPTKEASAHRFFCVSFDNRVEEYKVGDQKYHLIGRAGAGATILLHHPETSPKHAIITQDAKGKYYLMDLGSRSGTFLGKMRLTPNNHYQVDMQSNVKVRFGDRKKDIRFDMAQLVLHPGSAQLRSAEQRSAVTSRAHDDSAMQVDGDDRGRASAGATDKSTQASQVAGHGVDRLGSNSGIGNSRETERKRPVESNNLNGLSSGQPESEPNSKRHKASNGMCHAGHVPNGKTIGDTAAESKASDSSHECRPTLAPQPSPPAAPQQHKQQHQHQQQQQALQQKKKQEQQQSLPLYGPELPPARATPTPSCSSSGALLGDKDENGFHRFEPQKPRQSTQDTWASGTNGRLSNGATGSHLATNSRLRNGSTDSNGRLSNGSTGSHIRLSNGSTGNHIRLSNGSTGNHGRISNGSAGSNGIKVRCDKCDQAHPTEQCPFFKGGRDKHKDAWVNYGRKHPLEMGTSGGNFVLKRARHIRQPGDGSCLFHSLSFGLKSIGINGYDNSAMSLRRAIANFIHRNASLEIAGDTIEEWVKWDSESSVKSYASRMSVSGWGGGIEMAACSRLKGVNIHVYQHKRGEYHRISCFDAPNASRHTKTIHILYVGGMHYDALAPC